MDIFKFDPIEGGGYPRSKLMNGVMLSGYTDVTWIERYRDAGEFTIKAPEDSQAGIELNVGSYISHLATDEVMVVENCIISLENGQSMCEFSGRSFETILETRVVGANQSFVIPPVVYPPPPFGLTADYTWEQAVTLVDTHIGMGVVNPDDKMPWIEIITDIVYSPSLGIGSVNEARLIDRGNLYTRFLELLAIENLGIKSVRPRAGRPPAYYPGKTTLLVYYGADKSNDVIFATGTDSSPLPNTLISMKDFYTAAMVSGKWIEVMYNSPSDGDDLNRRIAYLDGKFIDDHFDSVPTGVDLTATVDSMNAYAAQYIAGKSIVTLVDPSANDSPDGHTYGKDYDLGDIVSVRGRDRIVQTMRVIEHATIVDDSGTTGYPTFGSLAEEF